MKFSKRMLSMFLFVPLFALALDIAVNITHSATEEARTNAALQAIADFYRANEGTQIPYESIVTFVYSDHWKEDGRYFLNQQGIHDVKLQPLTQRSPNSATGGGGGGAGACVPTIRVTGDYIETVVTQGGEQIGYSLDFYATGAEISGCEGAGNPFGYA
ncbi:MAG: hypothetical protein JNM52_01010 [Betaproteobacteria bacterium]|nr:hypothetical protein [Betaproteobacteria bacterium]